MLSLRTSEQFKTRKTRVLTATIGLVLTYILATRAIDTGSWWQYLGAFLLLILSIRLLKRAFKKK